MTDRIVKKLAALQAELDSLRKEVRETPVGYVYDKSYSGAPTDQLMRDAVQYEAWLANKTRGQGPGAACDSGEARVCALLREFVRRFSE